MPLTPNPVGACNLVGLYNTVLAATLPAILKHPLPDPLSAVLTP